MSDQTMAAGFASAFLDYAEAEGAPRDRLLAAAGLTEDDLADQDMRVPVASYHTLIAAGIKATGDTSLLLRHVLETRLETMSIVGQIVHASTSFPHSLDQLNRYARLMADVPIPGGRGRFEIQREGNAVWVVDHRPSDGNWMATESGFARFISEFRRSAPEYPFEQALEVTYAPPPHANRYPELFRVPVTFRAKRNALRINPVWLDEAFDGGKDYVFGIFTRHADALLEDLATNDTVRSDVETRMLADLHEGSLSMDRIARDLGMSRQTLYRRLKDEGVTFAQVHDDLRRRMAMDYLSTRKVSVGETAYLLGFSEASAFVRAFRRWTGSSPTVWLGQNE
ncbi:AraC family transcriptional regulator [Psychromarinibacter halotolerans]|uniref:AraC family transcriptional regulator ligand-binding domain-containing protein n=1 Tax=Psychromarinibacter halotolerans TaxID=1775175 RepID=A0ABV7GJM3_9RHOB|nr:AraC family transcriptional regulator [Psychromarinibacter halotolerans]MDF0595958.1 AraC family transcriptional regulator ligand-binding domain-containing protein [Psychromarinibacter halotolerans]